MENPAEPAIMATGNGVIAKLNPMHHRGKSVSTQTQTPPSSQAAAAPQTGTRGFWSLIGLQSQGAFSDNVFKTLLMMWVLNLYASDQGKYSFYSGLIGALIPGAFLTFSCWAGMMADKFSKRTIILATKTVELAIAAIGLFVLLWADHRGDLGYGSFMAFMGASVLLFIHSAFFSPSKYGIIPELVPEQRLA
jgi:acyl-[acyl-carrier-protein]-phospholipid O-acyltransferase/long-chain-fatty-acid--[acyl-carrier-protein] ligase